MIPSSFGRPALGAGLVLCALSVPVWMGVRPQESAIEPLTVGGFSFVLALTLPGAPEAIYDAVTGDISGWWDHSFSEKPARFYIEPKPGGGFWEIFDESGAWRHFLFERLTPYIESGRHVR